MSACLLKTASLDKNSTTYSEVIQVETLRRLGYPQYRPSARELSASAVCDSRDNFSRLSTILPIQLIEDSNSVLILALSSVSTATAAG